MIIHHCHSIYCNRISGYTTLSTLVSKRKVYQTCYTSAKMCSGKFPSFVLKGNLWISQRLICLLSCDSSWSFYPTSFLAVTCFVWEYEYLFLCTSMSMHHHHPLMWPCLQSADSFLVVLFISRRHVFVPYAYAWANARTHTNAIFCNSPAQAMTHSPLSAMAADWKLRHTLRSKRSKSFLFVNAEGELATAASKTLRVKAVGGLRNKKAV